MVATMVMFCASQTHRERHSLILGRIAPPNSCCCFCCWLVIHLQTQPSSLQFPALPSALWSSLVANGEFTISGEAWRYGGLQLGGQARIRSFVLD